jgi:hypothetical protein
MTTNDPDSNTEAARKREEQEIARKELLSRLGEAYKAMSQAQGWVMAVDPELYGVNTPQEVQAIFQELTLGIEQAMDAADGNKFTQAQMKYHTLKPLINLALGPIIRQLSPLD